MPKAKQPLVLDRYCLYCGKQIVTEYSHNMAYREEIRYCSMACYHAHRRAVVGESARLCRRCGKEFRNKAYNYCLSCRRELAPQKAQRVKPVDERYSRVCPVCGKTFYKPLSATVPQWEQRYIYCSRDCYGKTRRKPFDSCAACGKPITAEGVARGQAKFCSRKCWASAKADYKPFPLCKVCGETVRDRARKFCSAGCFNEWHRGSNHPLYLGAPARDYRGCDWDRRAAEVRARDKVCRHCGKPPKPGKLMDVHHAVPWRVSHDSSLENLLALCASCHKKADLAYQKAVADQRQGDGTTS